MLPYSASFDIDYNTPRIHSDITGNLYYLHKTKVANALEIYSVRNVLTVFCIITSANDV